MVVLVLIHEGYEELKNSPEQRNDQGILKVDELEVVPQERNQGVLYLQIPHDLLSDHIHSLQRILHLEVGLQVLQIRIQMEEVLKHFDLIDRVHQNLSVLRFLQILNPHLTLIDILG